MKIQIAWSVDSEVYPKEAVFAACRRWSPVASFKIAKSGKKSWKITGTAKADTTKAQLQDIREGFEDEIMHQELRTAAVKESGQVRDAIIMRALVSASTEDT